MMTGFARQVQSMPWRAREYDVTQNLHWCRHSSLLQRVQSCCGNLCESDMLAPLNLVQGLHMLYDCSAATRRTVMSTLHTSQNLVQGLHMLYDCSAATRRTVMSTLHTSQNLAHHIACYCLQSPNPRDYRSCKAYTETRHML